MSVFDDTRCALGEGPLWHPLTQTLYWFDILNCTLFSRHGDDLQSWQFDEPVSAAGWVDETVLMVASASALWRFDTATGAKEHVVALEADIPQTRSNDGRADPWGGFWIGSMGRETQRKAGSIWRYYRGTLRQLHEGLTVSNAICFAPDKSCAYFTDTFTARIMRQPLTAADGWPAGPAEVHIDLRAERLNPDGAVTDVDGNLWVALWGAGKVRCFAPDGTVVTTVNVPATQPTCPAFGGAELRDLIVTSATTGLPPAPDLRDGATHVFKGAGRGVPEPRVIL